MNSTLRSVVGALALVWVTSTVRAEPPKVWIGQDDGFSRTYVTDGKIKTKAGFFGYLDVRELVSSPEAKVHAEKQSDFNRYAHFTYWLGVIPTAVLTGYSAGSNNDTLFWASLGGLVVTGVFTGYFMHQSQHHLYEAINAENGVPPLKLDDEEARAAPAPAFRLAWNTSF